ncbi:flagellar basal-body rod protein FlgG [Aureliella helgolandensis]|uniref:Flagellar basal-body rod protein FlgG n=1 Tax=Aureliella helgolandensis TaxID=2527968 RepID=A0A518G8X6_9BACT|nr:flagellar basal-body rod protein FlgG [Aureliella helgolandensis]QDV25055.1 Flagellar basal-body rod protein FlgG [Aureliella helgolandensis]
MSIQTLYTAATGMDAMQTKLDVIANNLANINTTAFKKDRANFEDLLYRNDAYPGMLDSQQTPTATGTQVGLGVRVQSTQKDFRQGAIQQTGRQLDVAIEGNGFMQVLDPLTQSTAYTRSGNLDINANGNLVIGSAQTGRLIEPPISIPQDATDIVISPNGQVSVRQAGNIELQQVGQLQMAQFINPDGLLKVGENLYQQTDASSSPILSDPGSDGLGILRQSTLEASNVEPVTELIDLITTQRGFELNSQAVQAGDQVLQLISNLRR